MKNLTIAVSDKQHELTQKLVHRPCHTRATISAFLRETAQSAVEAVDLQAWSDRKMRAYQAKEARAFGMEPERLPAEPPAQVGREGTE